MAPNNVIIIKADKVFQQPIGCVALLPGNSRKRQQCRLDATSGVKRLGIASLTTAMASRCLSQCVLRLSPVTAVIRLPSSDTKARIHYRTLQVALSLLW